MKRAVITALILVCLVLGSWWHRTIYQDQNVVVGRSFSLFSLINVHGAPRYYLKAHGRTYQHVRGLPPFYLKIPELNSILFVTDENHPDIVFHILDIGIWKELRIDGKYATFGWEIGSGRTNGAPYTEFIDRVGSNYVVAVSVYPDAKKSYWLNLSEKNLDKIIYDQFDSRGTLKKHSVYINGIAEHPL